MLGVKKSFPTHSVSVAFLRKVKSGNTASGYFSVTEFISCKGSSGLWFEFGKQLYWFIATSWKVELRAIRPNLSLQAVK